MLVQRQREDTAAVHGELVSRDGSDNGGATFVCVDCSE